MSKSLTPAQLNTVYEFFFNKKNSDPNYYRYSSTFGRCNEAYRHLCQVYQREMRSIFFGSIETQIEVCDNYVKTHNYPIDVMPIYNDPTEDHVSAGALIGALIGVLVGTTLRRR